MIKKNDFIELEYTGKTKEEGYVFDTTQESLAKKERIHNPQGSYGPTVICVGQQHILPGLDIFLEGKEIGSYTIELPPEEAFGKKSAKLIQLIPTSKFRQQKIQPQPGLQVNIDGHIGVVKTVTGGRTLVDFNHPLSGKYVVYDIKVNKKVNDKKEQLSAILKMRLGMTEEKVEVHENKATITSKHDIPNPIQEQMNKEIKELTGLTDITWKK